MNRLTDILMYVGLGLWCAVFITNNAGNIKGHWLIVVGICFMLPRFCMFLKDKTFKW